MPEERNVKEVFKNIPEGEKRIPLEGQERESLAMLKIISRK
jgi:hypothetical protein